MSNVDPIRYAWECCNSHVPFPPALTRGAPSSTMAASLSKVHVDPTPAGEIAILDAAQAALHAFFNGDAPINGDARQSLAEKMEERVESEAAGACQFLRLNEPGVTHPSQRVADESAAAEAAIPAL